MIRKLLTLFVIAGACNAYPHQNGDENAAIPTPSPVTPEKDLVAPETGPFHPEAPVKIEGPVYLEGPINPETGPVGPEIGPFPEEPILTDVPGPQDGPEPDESDLKTDATVWWYPRSLWNYPNYRNFPSYRNYWRPHYRPRNYYNRFHYG